MNATRVHLRRCNYFSLDVAVQTKGPALACAAARSPRPADGGFVVSGSALHAYDTDFAVTNQIELLKQAAEAGLPVRVSEVIEDKKRGLVARLVKSAPTEDAAVNAILGQFAQGWEWAV